jgi:hypothetical protein
MISDRCRNHLRLSFTCATSAIRGGSPAQSAGQTTVATQFLQIKMSSNKARRKSTRGSKIPSIIRRPDDGRNFAAASGFSSGFVAAHFDLQELRGNRRELTFVFGRLIGLGFRPESPMLHK